MEIFFTILAVAFGMLVGTAIGYMITHQFSLLKGFLGWVGVMILAIISVVIGRYCQQQVGITFPMLSFVPFIFVEGFSIVTGLLGYLRDRIKEEDAQTKANWFTLVIFICLVKLPIILWVVLLLFGPFNAFNSLAFSAFLGTICACVLWLGFNFAWLLLSLKKPKV